MAMGRYAWEFAATKAFTVMVIPRDRNALSFAWPVAGEAVILVEAGGVEARQRITVAQVLLEHGAALVYELLKKAVAKAPLHEGAVKGAELGLRGTRKAEEAAESARLKIADVMAEARERIGEEAPTPAVGNVHDHDH